jgi:hypothetical protein
MYQAAAVQAVAENAPALGQESRNTIRFVVLGAIILVGGIIAWKLGKGLIQDIKSITGEGYGDGLSDAMQQPTADGSTSPNIGITEAASIAQGLKSNMEGGGSRFYDCYNSLSGLNGKALQLVAQKFGTQSWDGVLGIGSGSGDLFEWFRTEFTEQEMAAMRALWAKSGLVF